MLSEAAHVRYRDAYRAETPAGDTYGLGVGHLVLPNGSLVAVAQNDDETAVALVKAGWAEWQKQPHTHRRFRMTATDPLAYLYSTGAPVGKFLELGTEHSGVILKLEQTQQTDLEGNKKFYDDDPEKPMWQLVITIETGERDPEIDNDDGIRRLYAKGNMLFQFREALKAAGFRGDPVGGHLSAKYVADGEPPKKGYSGPKQFECSFTPGANVVEKVAATAEAGGESFGDEEPF